MKSSENDIKLLEDYIRGRLDESTAGLVKSRLEAEESLKADYQTLKVIMKSAQVTKLNSKLKMLQKFGTEEKTTVTNQPVPKVMGRPWPLWLKAACILGVILVSALYFILTGEKTYPQKYASLFEEHFDTELIVHKTFRAVTPTDQLTAEQRRAYDIYSIQNFKRAKPLLKELWESSSDTIALFYWGISELGLGNEKKAMQILHKKELSGLPPVNKYFINK